MISRAASFAILASFAACFIEIGILSAAPPIDQAGEYQFLIPAAARVAGLGGSTWRTEATFDNPGDQATTVHLYLLERNRDNTDASGKTVVIEAGESLYLADLITDIFERDDVAGAVFIGADQPILVESRTYSSGAAGTYGQRIPGLQIRPPVVSGGDPMILTMATENESYRTNFGISNAGGEPVTVITTFFDPQGAPLTTRTDQLPPWGVVQSNRVLADIGPIDDAWATFSTNPDHAQVSIFTSVVDNLSHDPIFASASPTASEPSWVVAAAHTDGLNSTRWRTDLIVVNPNPTAISYAIELLPSDTDNSEPASASFELGPRAMVRHEDVVWRVFGFSGVGALRIVPGSGGLVVSSRTFTETDTGSLGQFIPGIAENTAIPPTSTGRLIHLSSSSASDSGSRTNIGFVNPGETPAIAATTVSTADGVILRSLTSTINALGHTQENLFAEVPADDRKGASAVVTAAGPDTSFFAYASVVDNRSGDPVFIPATALPAAAEPLEADFGWQPDTVTAGQAVSFEDRSTGLPDSWTWTFGDGSTSHQQDPPHTFADAGTYTVTLAVTRGDELSSTEASIDVLPRALMEPCGTISTEWAQVVTWAIDADSDGFVDLLVTPNRSSPDTVKILRNDGELGFSEMFAAHIPGGGLTEAAVADFDGNGLDDFVVTVNNDGSDPPGVVFFENLGNGSFAAHQTGAPLGDALELTVFDVDGDLDLDLIVPDFDAGWRIYRNLGGFTFSEKRVSSVCEFFAFGDLTGNGRVDMACGDVAELAVVLDIEGEAIQIPAIDISEGSFRTMRIRDLDGDGRQEILASVFVGDTTGAQSGRLDLFEVTGTDVTLTWSSREYPGYPHGVQVCDFDDDGADDLLFSSGGVHVELAEGSGFHHAGTATNLVLYDRFVCEDLDLDGDVEIVTGCRCDLQVLCR